MPPRPVVAAAIVDSLEEPTCLLAAQRCYPAELDGLYELPGGKVEDGEAPLVALAREIREELGTQITMGPPVPGPTPTQEGEGEGAGFAPWPILQGRVMWVWLAEVAPGAPRPRTHGSHRDLRWVKLEDALGVAWIPTNLPIVVDTLTRIATSRAERPTNGDLPLTLSPDSQ